MIDRHAFASNASSFDTAWRTFGWTPAIRERAGRLEEDVPWATVAARAARPGRLRGRAEDVLLPGNFDALQFAFLPLDGRLGFSVWGALDRVSGSPEWRVLTHTLLFDRAAFERMSGYPFALLRDSRYTGWFRAMVEMVPFDEPAELMPLPVPAEADARAVFEHARLREVSRLTELLLAQPGADAALLESRLAAIYEALASARTGGRARRVALRSRAPLTEALLTRLAWITLPLDERADVFFSTEQRRMASPPATLFVLAEAEWGQFVPDATRVLDGGVADVPRGVAVGRRHWARAVAQGAGLHARLAAAAELRGWLIIARDDVSRLEGVYRWRRRCREQGITLDSVKELITLETTSSAGRARIHWRAIGHVLARAVQHEAADAAVIATRALDVVRGVPRVNRVMLLRAAVRTLLRGSAADRQAAGFLRLGAAGAGEADAPWEELLRLLDVEARVVSDVLGHAQGGAALFAGATTLALQGHAVAERLALLAWPRLPDPLLALRDALTRGDPSDPRARRWADMVLDLLLASGDAGMLERLVAETEPAWLLREDVLARVLDAMDVTAADRAAALAGQVADRVLAGPHPGGEAVGAGDEAAGIAPAQRVDLLLRLSWMELRGGARDTALERYADAQPGAALPLLVQLLCSTPPLPLFLTLRRYLLRVPAAQLAGAAVERWLPDLEDHCPALHARLTRRPAPFVTLSQANEWKRSASAAAAR